MELDGFIQALQITVFVAPSVEPCITAGGDRALGQGASIDAQGRAMLESDLFPLPGLLGSVLPVANLAAFGHDET
jgi:hypothetical protein